LNLSELDPAFSTRTLRASSAALMQSRPLDILHADVINRWFEEIVREALFIL
jgi:hypothetical protein